MKPTSIFFASIDHLAVNDCILRNKESEGEKYPFLLRVGEEKGEKAQSAEETRKLCPATHPWICKEDKEGAAGTLCKFRSTIPGERYPWDWPVVRD